MEVSMIPGMGKEFVFEVWQGWAQWAGNKMVLPNPGQGQEQVVD